MMPMKKSLFIWIACVLALLASACQPARSAAAPTLDTTPRLAVITAFAPEMGPLMARVEKPQRFAINGRSFITGKLAGHDVVLFQSGVSMVNAAMTTQAAFDHFKITGVVFSGIAGGANPDLHIGDVVVPAEWAEYQEQVFARQTASGWSTGYHPATLGNFGMMFPQPVTVTRAGGALDGQESKFWFSADPQMLTAARSVAATAALQACPKLGACLRQAPRVVVGGKGVSGPTFVDNAEYRQWVWQNFKADAVDMETAAVAHVAYTNQAPFLAFRSLSDLAGGGPGENEITTFLQLAAGNASSTVLAFLNAYQ